jgi:hypothetical protein
MGAGWRARAWLAVRATPHRTRAATRTAYARDTPPRLAVRRAAARASCQNRSPWPAYVRSRSDGTAAVREGGGGYARHQRARDGRRWEPTEDSWLDRGERTRGNRAERTGEHALDLVQTSGCPDTRDALVNRRGGGSARPAGAGRLRLAERRAPGAQANQVSLLASRSSSSVTVCNWMSTARPGRHAYREDWSIWRAWRCRNVRCPPLLNGRSQADAVPRTDHVSVTRRPRSVASGNAAALAALGLA